MLLGSIVTLFFSSVEHGTAHYFINICGWVSHLEYFVLSVDSGSIICYISTIVMEEDSKLHPFIYH